MEHEWSMQSLDESERVGKKIIELVGKSKLNIAQARELFLMLITTLDKTVDYKERKTKKVGKRG